MRGLEMSNFKCSEYRWVLLNPSKQNPLILRIRQIRKQSWQINIAEIKDFLWELNVPSD